MTALIGLFALVLAGNAQPSDTLWTRTYGGADDDWANSVQQTSDGGYVLAGGTGSFGTGTANMWLVRTDANGDTLWTRTWGSNYSKAYSVQQTADGGYVLAGETETAGGTDMCLVKTDADGGTMWTRTYGGSGEDYAYSVQQTSDGGYALAGWTQSFGLGGGDMWLVKTDANGDSLWSRTYGGSSADWCYAMQATSDGGYVLAGGTYSFGAGGWDMWLVKTNANGDTLWTRTYGGSDVDVAHSVQQTGDSGYVLAGKTCSFGIGIPMFENAWLVKTDVNGDTLWTRTHGGSGDDWANSVQLTSDGGYVLGGLTLSFGTGWGDMWLVKSDAEGNTLWTRTYGGNSTDYAYSVQQTSDGGYVLAGTTRSFGIGIPTHENAWLAKTGPELGVDEQGAHAVRHYALSPCYPNPFNSSATLSYDLPSNARVSLDVFDVLGRRVTVLEEGLQIAGEHEARIDGRAWSSGVYVIRLQAGSKVMTRKAVLLR